MYCICPVKIFVTSLKGSVVLFLSFLYLCGFFLLASANSDLDVKKTLSSAIANAENNFQYDIDKLIVKEAYCGKQVVMKRFRARAKGRAAEIMKPYSNLTIILTEQNKQMEKDGTKS